MCCAARRWGRCAPKAHDMVREARVLQAVHPHFPPAPEVYLVCEDAAVIGAPFFLMERRRGIVLRDRIPPEVSAHAELRAAASAGLLSIAWCSCMRVDVEKHGSDCAGQAGGVRRAAGEGMVRTLGAGAHGGESGDGSRDGVAGGDDSAVGEADAGPQRFQARQRDARARRRRIGLKRCSIGR